MEVYLTKQAQEALTLMREKTYDVAFKRAMDLVNSLGVSELQEEIAIACKELEYTKTGCIIEVADDITIWGVCQMFIKNHSKIRYIGNWVTSAVICRVAASIQSRDLSNRFIAALEQIIELKKESKEEYLKAKEELRWINAQLNDVNHAIELQFVDEERGIFNLQKDLLKRRRQAKDIMLACRDFHLAIEDECKVRYYMRGIQNLEGRRYKPRVLSDLFVS